MFWDKDGKPIEKHFFEKNYMGKETPTLVLDGVKYPKIEEGDEDMLVTVRDGDGSLSTQKYKQVISTAFLRCLQTIDTKKVSLAYS